jgi:hypothetical protein
MIRLRHRRGPLRREWSVFPAGEPLSRRRINPAAFAATNESGRTPVRPLVESKSRDALNEPHVPFDFFFGPFFFFAAITLLLGFDELDPTGIEFKAPSPDHRKTMVHYK